MGFLVQSVLTTKPPGAPEHPGGARPTQGTCGRLCTEPWSEFREQASMIRRDIIRRNNNLYEKRLRRITGRAKVA